MLEDLLKPLVSSRFAEDETYRAGHIRIINPLPGRTILGLHIPEMKALAAALVRGGRAEETLRGFEELLAGRGYADRTALCYEDLMVWGFVINAMKVPEPDRFARVAKFVPAIDNWAVCDSFCSSAKWMKKTDREVLWNFLQDYFDSGREFGVRFALVVSMVCLLEEAWLDRVFARVEAIDYAAIVSEYRDLKPPYYVRMGAAWLLATALARFPERTRRFVTASRIPDEVKRLYARKARESFRTRTVPAFDGGAAEQ